MTNCDALPIDRFDQTERQLSVGEQTFDRAEVNGRLLVGCRQLDIRPGRGGLPYTLLRTCRLSDGPRQPQGHSGFSPGRLRETGDQKGV